MKKLLSGLAFVFAFARLVSSQIPGFADVDAGEKKIAKVTASLVSEVKTAVAGQSFRVAVKLVHAPHNHTYGKKLPADGTGQTTALTWELPDGWKAEELPWPEVHELVSTGGEKSLGYDETVYLPAKITPAASAIGSADLVVKIKGLVCDPQSCMPFKTEAKISIALGAAAETDSVAIEAFGKAVAAPAAEKKTESPAAASATAPVKPTADAAASKAGEHSFGVYLIFAFIGGLILNVMPCVFPVLGIKVMSVVKQAGEDRAKVVAHGIAYTFGILITFWALGAIVISLGKGWAFQFQSPVFVFGLCAFFLVFALNMAGVFEIGASAVGVGSDLQAKQGLGGSFFSGLLATIVATPCSAPFLGSALGFAVTLPPVSAMLMFTLIGLGLASPFLLLSFAPSLVAKLPRPGAWMESFKQGMSFLLFGTVAFLVWVLTSMVEGQPMLFLLFGLVLVSLGCWVYGRWSLPHKPARTRMTAVIMTLVFVVGGLRLGWPRAEAAAAQTSATSDGSLLWEVWTPAKVAELRKAGIPVYIDFTAKWCLTCQVNKRVYHDTGLQSLFQKKKVTLLKADWTNENEDIKQALAALGKAAVPVNVLYIPGQDEPLILPELLSVDNVTEALNKLP